ncbi:SIMPL domain-containing protein [Agrococcus sp. SL85]|uniref:SIMPL domain-containing protein n=1 Tax=Agrococcus sp. SL85 TaxID=2995141 RepID=UPI00226CBD2D|nr:SIMPL domain-containing protein [Agrococcus sp. SL85]WAC66240.1 SIMPL domain-containing protein [Agrococcus sp. SL85]
MVHITVQGTGSRRAAAERAELTVQSRWQTETPADAMATVQEAHARVVAEVKELVAAGAAESWHADRVWLSHHREWRGDDKAPRLVYAAAASVTATFIDLDALGRWIAALGGDPVLEVGDIEWRLTEPTRRELARGARADAVADAVERAQDYARAAAIGEVRVVEVREPSPFGSGPSPKHRVHDVMMAGAPAGGSVELQAGELEVEAHVEATFATGGDAAGR